MGNLISAIGFENTSTPFDLNEHNDIYTDPQRQYHDFSFSNTKNKTCTYPKFWADDGLPVGKDVTDQLKSCFDSEFDQVSWKSVVVSCSLS
jgi:alpha-1,3-glucan synthase